MDKLDEIEAHILSHLERPKVRSEVLLITRAVRQLGGTRKLQGFEISDLLRVIADDYNRPDVGSMVKQRRSMWLNDLADKMDKADPDVLELIEEANE
jgi:hypothetical protein